MSPKNFRCSIWLPLSHDPECPNDLLDSLLLSDASLEAHHCHDPNNAVKGQLQHPYTTLLLCGDDGEDMFLIARSRPLERSSLEQAFLTAIESLGQRRSIDFVATVYVDSRRGFEFESSSSEDALATRKAGRADVAGRPPESGDMAVQFTFDLTDELVEKLAAGTSGSADLVHQLVFLGNNATPGKGSTRPSSHNVVAV